MTVCTCGGPAHPRSAAVTEALDVAFPVPAYPPRSWFTEKPEWMLDPEEAHQAWVAAGGDPLVPIQKVQVDDSGRVAGYFYNDGQCLVHDHAACPRPSPTGYAAFHQSALVVDDGEQIAVGVIGNVNGHASPFARVDVAQAHYADPSRQLMAVRAYDDAHGGYILGAMVPHATYGDVALVRRSPLSGDWRPMPSQWWSAHAITADVVDECEGYDCIGPTLVTRPGLPLVRAFRGAVGDDDDRAAILGGVGGVQWEEELMSETKVELPGGVVVTTNAQTVQPGPQPILAAQPPPPPPPPKGGGGPPQDGGQKQDMPSMEQVVEAIQTLDKRVAALEQALGAQAANVKALIAALEDDAPALPPEWPPLAEAVV